MISCLQIATLEKEKVLEELQKVKQTKMQVINEGSLEYATKKTENSVPLQNSNAFEIHTNQVMVVNSQSDITDPILRKSSIDKGRSGKSQTVTFNINDSESSIDPASDSPIASKSKGLKMESSSHKIQGLRGRISIKRLIKTNMITQEIALKLQTGLITMEEIEASLAQFVGKPSSIAGVYIESSKKKLSFLDAVAGGLISKTYAIEFLEAQAATGYIIDPMTGEDYSPSDAFEKGIITEDLKDKISDAYKAVSGYTHAGKILSVFQAMEERILDRHRGKAIIETQIATGGLIHPLIGSRVPMDCALEQGLINQTTLQSLYDPVSNPKDFHYPETGQKAYYSELLRICVYDVNGGVYLLPFGDQHLFTLSPSNKHRISVINTSNGAKMSAYEAYKAGHIDKRTYLFLSRQESEWQEITIMDSSRNLLHILTDHKTGRQLSIENALSLKILQMEELNSYRSGQLSISEFADLLISRRVVFKVSNGPVAGLWDVSLKKRLPVFKGHQLNLVDRLTALRLLEAQACTGGICDPASGERVLITEALHRGLLDEGFARQIQQCEQAYYGIIHPQNGKTLTVAQAMQENLFPKDVAVRCLEFQLATGGLINPESQERVSLEDGIQNCLIDKATAAHLQHDNSHLKCITCPKTKRKISFKDALEKSVFDSHTGFVLLEVTKPHSTGNTSFQYFWTYRHF
ncbi:plectin-like [Rhinichthys klamathensis goyatoka]|uniref:plectin-like n=1 Tax=Rhinichthys klamathensis goyatoka TaxID=3034132 RepID=UPI0024B54B18|nr:plectin-like [Rhinichthys klamathensis goyatoka]